MAYGIFLRDRMTFAVNESRNKYFLIWCTLKENTEIDGGVLTPPHAAIFIEWAASKKKGKIYKTSNTHTHDTS